VLTDVACIFQPNGSAPIHLAHVQGMPHQGVYMAVRDRGGKLLLLRRGPQLKTCAGTWGLLGEHMHEGEDPLSAVHRALDEEMGVQLRQRHVSAIVNISTIWYRQVYLDGRRERQATHIWAVLLNDDAEQVLGFSSASASTPRQVLLTRWCPAGGLAPRRGGGRAEMAAAGRRVTHGRNRPAECRQGGWQWRARHAVILQHTPPHIAAVLARPHARPQFKQ